ncbi:MAG: hypothetical protein ACREYD_15165 [Casimicrobiaceae bacterium]
MNKQKIHLTATLWALAAVCIGILAAGPAAAHGIAGKRFFPATLATDDPFVADELSLPTIESRKMSAGGDEPATRETGLAIDVSKRVTENFGIGLGATYLVLRPDGGDTQRGFDNLEANAKYKFYQSDEHETILSAGIDWDIGGSGSKRVGAESFSTLTPALFFGKGFGDLPDTMQFLRPLAVTGLVGLGIPTRSGTTTIGDDGEASVERHPHTLEWGFAVEYSLPYLQSFVRDVGLRAPFNQLIPVVEFAMSTALDRDASGTTGTVNPGIIWAGRYAQLAVEAVVPVNNRSGSKVGWIAQLHFFLDDLFPTTIGQPIFRQ